MFESEVVLNQFLRGGLNDVLADIPDDRIYERSPGNGHPPVWVLGHLAICGELGEKFCGGDLTHTRWLPVFGPGSSDEIEDKGRYSKSEFVDSIHSSYERFATLSNDVTVEAMQVPHGIELLDGTAIRTAGDVVAHLLSSHFAFHLAQLSAWRRAAGHGPLF